MSWLQAYALFIVSWAEMPLRRTSTLLLLAAVIATTIYIFSVAYQHEPVLNDRGHSKAPSFTRKLPSFTVPDFRFSFRTASHKPPEQKNSTSGASSWFSDWKWLNPFSSSITLDENRSVLPPLHLRPPIYTYYDSTTTKEEASHKVDRQLLSTWRRAWWAHGFRPVVLGPADALNNPLYESLRVLDKGLPTSMESDLFRWLSWSHMGPGLLSNSLCLPMGAYDDLLLSHLRRGYYPELTRFDGLGSGLFAGDKAQIDGAIEAAFRNLKLNSFKTLLEAIPAEMFRLETSASLAYYDSVIIGSKYPTLAKALVDNPSKGRQALNDLIISHLHTTWQNTFSKGIAVLKPLPAHTSALIAPSFLLAQLLAQCRESILQSSCPPNKPRCSPCVASRMTISTPDAFRNTSSLYTIGTVPHPYTLITLNNQTDAITVTHIRRHTERDAWLVAVTKDILGSGRGGPSRLMGLKDAVASEYGLGRSLWLTVEHFPTSLTRALSPPSKAPSNDAHPEPEKTALPDDWLEQLDWHFGFPIPRTTIQHGESTPPVPGPERWPKSHPGLPAERKKSADPDPPSDKQMGIERELLGKAREVINSKDRRIGRMRDIAEAWNLADAEAWKFVRAYRARSQMERLKWEEDEKGYGDRTGKGVGRWWRF